MHVNTDQNGLNNNHFQLNALFYQDERKSILQPV